MRVNARKEEFEHVELFGKPALYTSSRIDRSTVPKGFYCYDLRGSDCDPGKPVRLENWVVANHAGTVVTAKPITIPKSGAKQLSGKLNFLGESLTLAGFCGEHGLELPHDNRKFIPRPALPEEAGLFFALPEEQDAALGAIGHIRIDFGRGGDEFWHTWHPRGDEELNSPAFKAELTEVMNELREFGPLGNLAAMYRYCGEHDGKIEGGWRQNYGYVVETEHYRYCLRCSPGQGDYHAYLTAFDLQVQKMDMKLKASEQKFGLTDLGKQMLRNAADNTLPHSYSWFVFRDINQPGEVLTGDLTLPEAIRLYNEMDSDNKRIGVTKDEIATVDFVIMVDGKQWFSDDYTKLASFSSDESVVAAVETLKNEITEQSPGQGMTMGGMNL
ncbi:MAG: hypothetical protein GXW99_05725 [Clostridiales bacterium]|nr:hypothetical protein [Clostridiales bacterium]